MLFETDRIPQSISRAINKFQQEQNPKTEQEIIEELHRSRTNTLIALRFLSMLIIVPLITQQVSKYIILNSPVLRTGSDEMSQVFLNHEMRERAFKEIHHFEEKLKFDALISSSPSLLIEQREEQVKQKATELVKEFRGESRNAVSNVFADLIAFITFILILINSQDEIVALKAFMDKFIYGLSDSAKACIIILSTDIFLGFHSPHGWEVVLEGMARHLGLVANHDMIFLCIATVPVLLDTTLKYWTFRYLRRMSPSTLATLKEMH
jgi:CemA family